VTAVLDVRGLGKSFGEVQALRDVNFSIEGPGLVGILGPNGAGKTTLLDILEGLASPSVGEVRIFGAGPDRYPRARVGVVLQKEFSLDGATVGEYAELFAAIYGVRDGAERILRAAALEARARVALERLSGGEAARLFVATAQVHEPDLLFLDEPTAHLDPRAKRELGEVLRGAAKRRTVVMTTHDLREAEICDQLIFLVGGSIRAQGPREALVAAAPDAPAARDGVAPDVAPLGVERAFFHYCAVRIGEGGDAQSAGADAP
jgi:ABC-2 type transport system ATP-binding protein